MRYALEWRPSPNYTPNSQVRSVYGRPRTIEFGAGHWWGDPNAGYSHQGVVNTFLNPARQAAAHAVVSAGRVTEMVRPEDAAWCTNNANPFTVAIELKPNMTAADKETCAEYIADKGWHNLPWRPHNTWWQTACNPLPWGEIMARAQQIWRDKHQTPAPAPTPAPPATATIERHVFAEGIRTFIVNKDTNLWAFNSATWGGIKAVKGFKAGDRVEIYGYAVNKNLNATYFLTKYSYDNGIMNGFNQADMTLYVPPAPVPTPPVAPEWQRNLRDIAPVKLMVLPAQTQIVNLNDLTSIKPLGQGTWVDFTKITTVQGKEYLISSYSATNGMPNGILKSDVGLPTPEPPVEDKPEWVKNWQDIADVDMYARVDAPVVNLLDGKTTTTIKRGTKIAIASATEWHGQKYLITKYSTDKNLPHGIALADLDLKPIEADPAPVPPVQSTDDLIKETNAIVKAIKSMLESFIAAVKNALNIK